MEMGWELRQEGEQFVLVQLPTGHRDQGFLRRRITLDPVVLELLDRMYCAGHRQGWERGAYEEQQQEDVEPDVLMNTK